MTTHFARESAQFPSLEQLRADYGDQRPARILAAVVHHFGEAVAFANSFGPEDLVLQHMLIAARLDAQPFVLDTGRLPAETYALIELWRERFGLQPRILVPDRAALEAFLQEGGPNSFYRSRAQRLSCCQIRKLAPLERALSGKSAWIVGLRRSQSSARGDTEVFSLDDLGRIKVSPLAAWTEAQVWDYIREHNLPYNALHDQAYPSIGCAPCTRAVAPGADPRSGRWWWEQDTHRECGLHTHALRGATAKGSGTAPLQLVAITPMESRHGGS